jgi:hypothetical protein
MDYPTTDRARSTGYFQFVTLGRSRVGGSGRESRMIGKSHYVVWMMNSEEQDKLKNLYFSFLFSFWVE